MSKIRIREICVLMMVIWVISPPLSYSGAARLLVLMGVGLFLFISINSYRESSKYAFILIAGLMGYIYVASFISGESVSLRSIPVLIYLCNVILFMYYRDNPREIKELKRVLWIALFINTVFNITTLNAYNTQANVSRLLAKNFDGAEVYASQGIGGFGFVYTTLIILPLDFALLRNKQLKLPAKLLVIAHILTAIFMVISSGYTLAVLSLLVIAVISLIIPINYNRGTMFKRGLLILGIVFVIFLQWDSIESGLVDVTQGTMYEDKVHDILYGVEEGEEGSLDVRLERYRRSIQTFFENPIFGSMKFADVGKHSFILDTYGQYGFFVGTAFLTVLTMSGRYYYKKKTVAKKTSIIMIILPVMLLTLNSMVFAYSVVLFVLYPIVNSICEEGQIEKSKYSYSGVQRRELYREMH